MSALYKSGLKAWIPFVAMAVLAWAGASAGITKTLDRRFPAGWCPIDSRAGVSGGTDLSFTAPSETVRITFSGRNRAAAGFWEDLRLDSVTVVLKSVFDAGLYVPNPNCYDDANIPPGQATAGTPNAPAYDFSAFGPEVSLDRFSAGVDGWTGAHTFWQSEDGSLGLGRPEDGDVEVTATKLVGGLAPGQQYVIFAWWHSFEQQPLQITIDAACADGDGDGYVVCGGGCTPDAGQNCGECADAEAGVHPGAPDTTCNGIDDNCNGSVDESFPGACQCTEPGGDLVGWWPADGTTEDARGGHAGVLQNGASYTTGLAGQAFHLDGVDDSVGSIGDLPTYSFLQNSGVFTISAWVRIADPNAVRQQAITSNTPTTVEKGHFFLWDNSDGNKRLRVGLTRGVSGVMVIDSVSPPDSITTTAWHHVAAVGDGTRVTFYVDGVESAGTGAFGAFSTGDSSRALSIGSCPYTSPQCQFHGDVDEVQVYDRALSGSEVRAIHSAAGNPMCRCTDVDGDGFGPTEGLSCGAGTQQDCDDTLTWVHPGAPDVTCNGIDDDCDSQVDEGFATTCQCSEPGDGLRNWWPAEGNASDIRGGSGGTPVNGASYAPGMAGQAFALDGVDDYVGSIGAATTFSFVQNTGVFSITAWVNLDDPSALVQQAIAANTGTSLEKGFFFLWDNIDGLKRLFFGAMRGVDGVPVVDSRSPANAITTVGWHHVAVVGDGEHVTFYVDGVALPGGGTFGTLSTGDSTRVLSIGRCPAAFPGCQFDGRIDELQIYDRSLGATEIRAIHASGAVGMCQCIDADADGFGAQAGFSCPRGTDGDCQDANPLDWGLPGEHATLRLNLPGTTVLTWADESPRVGPGVTYQVRRGPIARTPASSGPEICLESGIVGPSTVDSTIPPPNSGFQYYELGRNACGGGVGPICP